MFHITLSNDINVCTRQFVCHPLSLDEFHKIAERAPSNVIPTFLQVLRISMWFPRQRGTEQPLSLENLRFVLGKQLLAHWHCPAAASAVVLALGFLMPGHAPHAFGLSWSVRVRLEQRGGGCPSA